MVLLGCSSNILRSVVDAYAKDPHNSSANRPSIPREEVLSQIPHPPLLFLAQVRRRFVSPVQSHLLRSPHHKHGPSLPISFRSFRPRKEAPADGSLREGADRGRPRRVERGSVDGHGGGGGDGERALGVLVLEAK